MKAYQVVKDFESRVSEFAGSKFGVAVDNCTNAIFLCCRYLQVEKVCIPSRTYPSVPCSIIHAGGRVSFRDEDWIQSGLYRLDPYPIYDAAHLMEKNMYETNCKGGFMCISFSATKPVNIGKGGMILTDDEEAVAWFRKARYCGRNERPLMEDNLEMLGWNMYMTPEQAARGLLLMNDVSNLKKMPLPKYPDLSKFGIYLDS